MLSASHPSAATSLRVREPSERLRALAAEHDKLLGRIARRRATRDQLTHDIRDTITDVANELAALADEARRLDQGIHALFAALAADPTRSRRERAQLARLQRNLEDADVISPSGYRERDEQEPCTCGRCAGASLHDEPAPEGPAGPSAARPQEGHDGVLRTLYRRLAHALHPDRAATDADRAHRTEVMKQVTVAYQSGDFARLTEIERAWGAAGAATTADTEDELERRCAALERANAELTRQLRGLDRELRGLRNSADGRLTRDLRRARTAGVDDDPLAEARADIEDTRALHEHVRRFRDGEISLAELLEGPVLDPQPGDEDGDDELLAMLTQLAEAMAGPAPKRSAPKRKRTR